MLMKSLAVRLLLEPAAVVEVEDDELPLEDVPAEAPTMAAVVALFNGLFDDGMNEPVLMVLISTASEMVD
jgi:hypothetical protein